MKHPVTLEHPTIPGVHTIVPAAKVKEWTAQGWKTKQLPRPATAKKPKASDN